MKIDRVSANIRFSKDIGHGAWKVIELGAEESVENREDWQTAQAQLYSHLSQQLKSLWSGNGNGKHQEEPPKQPEHYCQEHATEFKRYTKGSSIWYSHRLPNGKYCKES